MKVMAINGSPNMGKGNTALVLDPFLEGMREAGGRCRGRTLLHEEAENKPLSG